MKMVKSLLLGSAAGMVAVAGAQAADLPVKAAPVQYVKICTLYGDGFYYIPGTDICIKFGGYVRADYAWNATGARTPHYSGTGGAQDRTVSPYSTRHRGNFQVDTRTQTAYGTLRTFASLQMQNENQTDTTNVSRAFIQWAGFTFGRTKSFSDPYGDMGDGTFRSLFQTQNQSDTGANGVNQIAYTYEFGNGMSFTLGADERRTKGVTNLSTAAVIQPGAEPTQSTHGERFPDFYGTLKINQAWGSWSVAVVGHEVAATYYTSAAGVPGYLPSVGCVAQPTTSNCTHPGDKMGWAVMTGAEIKASWISPGDRYGGFFNYGVGASAYAGGSNLSSPSLYGDHAPGSTLPGANNNIALGWINDGSFVNGGSIQLTTAWTAAFAYEHYWTSNFSSTVYGTYTDISYNHYIVNNRLFCGGVAGAGGPAAGVQNVTVAANVVCDPGFHYKTIGTHTDWYPVSGFRLAVDVLYVAIDSAYDGTNVTLSKQVGARPTGVYTAKDSGILAVAARAQRSFPAGGD